MARTGGTFIVVDGPDGAGKTTLVRRLAARLRDAGCPVVLSRYDGMIHGFFPMGLVIERARHAVIDAVRELRAAFSA